MDRIKTIDTLRGLSMMWMFFGHLLGWWLRPEYSLLVGAIHMYFDVIGSSVFLFVAGISTKISYHKRSIKAENNEDYSLKSVRNEYFVRALIILLIALIYNSSIAITLQDITWIWSWFVLLTVAICLLITWPLLNTSKIIRIIIALSVWVLNVILLELLTPSQGQTNINGLVYQILYNPINLDPLLIFFPFFLMGTVIGDMVIEVSNKTDHTERRDFIKNRLMLPLFIIGISLIIFGIFVPFPDQRNLLTSSTFAELPNFIVRGTLPWVIYTSGIMLVLFTVLLAFEEFEVIKTVKSFRFLFYFSYYSFTIYLVHNLMYFIFLKQLSVIFIWFFIAGAIILWGLMFRAIYNSKWRNDFSIKIWIGKLGTGIAKWIEQRREESEK